MGKHVIVIEGYGAKRREDENTISNVVTDLIVENNNEGVYYQEIWSNKRSCLDKITEALTVIPSNSEIVIVTKSYGGIRLKKWMDKHYTTLRIYSKITIIMVDPHGAYVGDGKIGPYCKRQPLSFKRKMVGKNMTLVSIRQENKYPTGAKFELIAGKDMHNIKIPNKKINHTNIVNSQAVRGVIKGFI